jgi:hypothetical protein
MVLNVDLDASIDNVEWEGNMGESREDYHNKSLYNNLD